MMNNKNTAKKMSINENAILEKYLNTLATPISKHKPDKKLSFIWANDAFYKMTGHEKKDFKMIWQDLKTYYKPYTDDFIILENQLAKLQEHRDLHQECIIRIPFRHDEIKWIKLSISLSFEVITIAYNDISNLINTQNTLISTKNVYIDNFQWMMAENAGNVYISDIDTYELLYLNKVACETLGTRAEQAIGKKCYEIIQGRSSPCPFCTNKYLKKDQTYEWEFYNPLLKRNFIIKDRMLNWHGHSARIELSHDTYSTEYKLAKKDQEREAILKTISAAMVRVDARDYSSILWCNDIFLKMIGYTKEQFKSERYELKSYMHPEDLKRAKQIVYKLRNSKESVVFEGRVYTRNKEERIWTLTLCYVDERDSWDGIPCFYSMGLDITDERQKIKTLQHKAEKDALTGIYNRSETENQIKNFIIEHHDSKGALFMIDTDNFKQINDTLGHIAGDMVLGEMATAMKKKVRDSDVVGRIGGDEFIIFMKNITSHLDAEKKAEELQKTFAHLFGKEKSKIQVTSSIGIALYPKDGHNFLELYANADKALYQAKIQGKNTYIVYNEKSCNQQSITAYSSLGATIDSQQSYSETSVSLADYAFRILFQNKDLKTAINLILEITGKRYDVSRAYIFETMTDKEHCSNTYEWCNEGITAVKEQLQNISYHDMDEYERVFDENSIFYCHDVTSLSKKQRQLFEAQGIHSTLQCAYYEQEMIAGFVGFDECTGKRIWTKEELRMLTLISQIISIFLKHKGLSDQVSKL